jgi:hypothetical protein
VCVFCRSRPNPVEFPPVPAITSNYIYHFRLFKPCAAIDKLVQLPPANRARTKPCIDPCAPPLQPSMWRRSHNPTINGYQSTTCLSTRYQSRPHPSRSIRLPPPHHWINQHDRYPVMDRGPVLPPSASLQTTPPTRRFHDYPNLAIISHAGLVFGQFIQQLPPRAPECTPRLAS